MKSLATATRRLFLGAAFAILFWGSGSCIHAASYGPSQTTPPGSASAKMVPLTHVIQVRTLSQDQAAQTLPVRIKGIVTDLPGYENSFFIEDGTGSISVDRTDSANVRAGDRVEVIGKTDPGLFAPSLMVFRVNVLGHGPLPAAMRVSYDDIAGGADDGQWIEVHGVVRSARISKEFKADVMILVVDLGGGSTKVVLQEYGGIDSTRLVDSTVQIRGVCTSNYNDKRQFIGLEVYVPERNNLKILRAAPEDPFASPVTAVRNALQFGQSRHRIKVSGVATYQVPGHSLYLQDGSDSIAVNNSTKEWIPPGTRVEAVGFPTTGEYAPILEDGFVRIVGHTDPPTPLRMDAQGVIVLEKKADSSGIGNYAPYDEQLLQLQAQVLETSTEGGHHVWILRQGSTVFEAFLPSAEADDRTANIGSGSVLSVTGICRVHADSERSPISFRILIRSPEDIVILKQAPWWTPHHTLLLLSGLSGVTGLVSLWVIVLRKRVEEQTRAIRASESSYRYLAEHDALTGLLNRRAILLALDRELAKSSREKMSTAIVLGDLDHFKLVNDAHGHLGGDAALRRFALALSDNIRSYDSAGRYGGEEFLLVLSGIKAADLKDRLEALHKAISNLLVQNGQAEFQITCSLGAVLVTGVEGDVDQEKALAAADRALYEAKETGRNRVVVQPGVFCVMAPEEPNTDPVHGMLTSIGSIGARSSPVQAGF